MKPELLWKVWGVDSRLSQRDSLPDRLFPFFLSGSPFSCKPISSLFPF